MTSRKFLDGLSESQLLYGKYVVAAVLLLLFIAGSSLYLRGVKARLSVAEREHKNFTLLMNKYTRGSGSVGPLKKRLRGAAGAVSPVTALEEIGRGLGLKDKIKSFKGVQESLEDGYKVGSVEVSIKDITINQFVNLLYEIDRYPGLLFVRELDLKTGFADNKSLDCSLKILLIRRVSS